MPEAADDGSHANFFLQVFEAAASRLEEYLKFPDYPPARPLTSSELGLYRLGRGAVRGWEIRPFNPEFPHTLRVFVDERYPYVPPMVALHPPTPKFSYPHIEVDGFLCLNLGEVPVDHTAIELVAEATLKRAVKLIEESFSNQTQHDFHEEILSYWSRVTDDEKDYYSLLDVSNTKARQVWVWRGTAFRLLAETQEEGCRWLTNKFGEDKEWSFEKAIFAPIEGEFLPSQYPKNASELHQILGKASEEARQHFEEMTVDFPSEVNVVLSTSTNSGPALLGLTVRRPQYTTPMVKAQENFNRGFRPGHMSASLSTRRYIENGGVLKKSDVQRVDPNWALSRDADPNVTLLSQKTVTLIGCGSVGSTVARLLVQSGITRLHLVDPDTMSWENIGRHALGAGALGFRRKRPKVLVLAQSLSAEYPHIEVLSKRPEKWETALHSDDAFLTKTDLIIMATGEWSADNAMNDLSQSQTDFPPILYGWTEAFAAAGHAVSVLRDGGCLACVFDDRQFKFEATKFPDKVFQAAACGSVFQPFAAIDLAPITAMIAKLGLDILTGNVTKSKVRTWIGATSILKKHNGKWTDLWATIIKNGDPFMKEIDLLALPDCLQKHTKDKTCDIQDQTASH